MIVANRKTIKILLFTLYILVVVTMACATFIEKNKGTDYAVSKIYGATWFTLLWGALALCAIIYFIGSKIKKASLVLLHFSFIIILLGALLTHLFAEKGMIQLRKGIPTNVYFVQDKGKTIEKKLPFNIMLRQFDISYHSGTTAATDYISKVTIMDGKTEKTKDISMNKIMTYKSYRFYQSSFDQDMNGSILSINSDPYGIPVTYTGYALLFLSLIWILINPKGSFRRLLKSDVIKKTTLLVTLLLSLSAQANNAPTLPKETAEKFGELNILYNDRICPLQTFAIDFTKKLYGASSYKGLTAEQVLTGWIFWGKEWSSEGFIKMKSGDLKSTLQLPDYVSMNTFFNSDMGGYILGPYVEEYYDGNHDNLHKQAADVDDKLQLVFDLRHGTNLKIFPVTENGKTTWYSPTDKVPQSIPQDQRTYIANVFSLLYQEALSGNNKRIEDIVEKMCKYQKKFGGNSLPSDTQVEAERIYNKIPFATILFIVNLTMGFATLFVSIYQLTKKTKKPLKKINGAALGIMALSFLALTFCEVLRWIVSGTIPMANGYETMLFVAWLVMLLSFIVYRKMHIVLTFGFLMSGFFLLVSHISQMEPQISHVMPVLNSPLLSVHVSIIMMSFALLSLTFICGVMAIIIRFVQGSDKAAMLQNVESLQVLSRIFLYPALTTLGLGIFIGAIWANISWGQYWSWDPKEVWALITFMVYAVVVHTHTLPAFKKPMNYHVYIILAFLTILMTYFGVNYFLGGMHSYA